MINIHKTQSRLYFELQLNYTLMFEDQVNNKRGMSHLKYFDTSVKCFWNT